MVIYHLQQLWNFNVIYVFLRLSEVMRAFTNRFKSTEIK